MGLLLMSKGMIITCMINDTPPKPSENDYIQRNDNEWAYYSEQYIDIKSEIRKLERQQEKIKNKLIHLSGESNSKGGGISVSKITRKGNIEYSIVPELKEVNLEQYRKDDYFFWKISETNVPTA